MMSNGRLKTRTHLHSVHFSALPALRETGETALEWAPAGRRASVARTCERSPRGSFCPKIRNVTVLSTIVIPNAVSAWNLIIARTCLQTSIPRELLEAALVDGCSYARFFWEVVIPLSGAIIAVLALFYSVAHWNSFFNGLIYLQDYATYPLQLILRDILLGYQASGAADDAKTLQETQRIADLMKYALILVASLPVMLLYPFLQRYFVKGVMIGARSRADLTLPPAPPLSGPR
jgi:hypothetical protein